MVKTLIQCDFDGTITRKDASFLILDTFGSKNWGRWFQEYREGKISVGRFNTMAFATVKADEQTFYEAIACLAQGNGIRATARIKHVDNDTVAAWLDKASQHVEAVSRYLMVNLHFEAVQLDEFWSFVKKRKRAVLLSNDYTSCMATSGSG